MFLWKRTEAGQRIPANTSDESGTVLGEGGCNGLVSGNMPTSSSLGQRDRTSPATRSEDALPSKGMGDPLFDHPRRCRKWGEHRD